MSSAGSEKGLVDDSTSPFRLPAQLSSVATLPVVGDQYPLSSSTLMTTLPSTISAVPETSKLTVLS